MKKIIHLLFIGLILQGFISFLYSYPNGISGYTLKSGTAGCGSCHGSSANSSLIISISGPDTLQPNQVGTYTLTMSGASGTACGVDIAASNGTLAIFDANLKVSSGELVHTSAKNLLTYTFKFTAPSSAGQYILYGTGCRKKNTWNHGTNFTINVNLPVELLSFTSLIDRNNIELKWMTATETNNKGFELIRNEQVIDFINGNGTTTLLNNYSFKDENLKNGFYTYKLKQIDFDGSFAFIGNLNCEINIADKFILEQNYPNPFNPSTNIKYTVVKNQLVVLKVFDVLGNEITTLVNEEKQPGIYKTEFKIQNTTTHSGTYFYRIKIGNFVETKKMIFLK